MSALLRAGLARGLARVVGVAARRNAAVLTSSGVPQGLVPPIPRSPPTTRLYASVSSTNKDDTTIFGTNTKSSAKDGFTVTTSSTDGSRSSTNDRGQIRSASDVTSKNDPKISLVIFDKDGTLICFHSMWSPWARELASNMEKATNLKLSKKIFDLFGFCSESDRVVPGLLAEATTVILREKLTELLIEEGIPKENARTLVDDNWLECDSNNPKKLKSLTDLHILFKALKENHVKIAVCTSDSRNGTEGSLKALGLMKYVDMIVCGDDSGTKPKPSPHNAHMICDALGVSPSETAVVGDTQVDVKMGVTAKLGKNIGVLSGVCVGRDLEEHADQILDSVKDVLTAVLPSDVYKEYYTYSSDDRHLVSPNAEQETGQTAQEDARIVSLIIFNLGGTLICSHSRWANWIDKFIKRLEEETGVNYKSDIYETLGLDENTGKIQQGLLAHGTWMQLKESLVDILKNKGNLYHEEAVFLVNKIWKRSQPDMKENLTALADLKDLFITLKNNRIKIAISTSDSREDTHSILNSIGIRQHIDMLVCGDDGITESEQSGKNVMMICKELRVNPNEVILVGDTIEDMMTGRNANVKTNIGVLSGAGTMTELEPHADFVVDNVSDVMPHAVKTKRKTDKSKPFPLSTDSTSTPTIPPTNFNNNSSIRLSGSSTIIPKRTFVTSSESSKASESFKATSQNCDYVIVGAGSAGCVLANRLSENGENNVVLLEAGPADSSWKIHMPAALMYNLCDDKYNWYYHSEPEPYMNDRTMYCPRGRVLGGSSSLNAMVYIRGHAFDYDRWESQGAAGWSYADCLPYFKKAQSHELGADEYRGGDGLFKVSRGKSRNPLFQAFIDAGVQAGYPFTEDMNGFQQEGFGWMDLTVFNGKRWSTSSAYLKPAMNRDNLSTITRAHTTNVIFEGTKAVGVKYTQGAESKEIRAEKEVILSGGAINSPQLLMLSGVGNSEDLSRLDIPTVVNLPGVGENLQDHLEVYVQNRCSKPITLYSAQWKFPHTMIRIGTQWFLTSKGPASSPHLESGAFLRSRPDVAHPDIQFHFLPSAILDHGRAVADCHAYQIHTGPMRPTSTGYVKLQSKNPKDHPRIRFNYLQTENDRREMRDSILLAREVLQQSAFDDFRDSELLPGSDVKTDKQLDGYAREACDSAYHPSCTCRMGNESDPLAVVDSEARVIGTDGLRVVDASIMPSVVSGNLNAPTVMIAEKAADIILQKPRLPQANVPVWTPATQQH